MKGRLTCAVSATSVQFIANLTLTAEQARQVVARPKDTDVWEGALINIYAGRLKGAEVKFIFWQRKFQPV